MLKIQLDNISKKFDKKWIFKNLNYQFETNQHCVIKGHNGSGKSTLLQLLATSITPTKGITSYQLNGKEIPVEEMYKYLSICTPYLELIEEFTLSEMIAFHSKFKKMLGNKSVEEYIDLLNLNEHTNTYLSKFSSGMKQRVKLGLAILSDTPLLLLDEPSSNLDAKAINWYQNLINDYQKDRLIIVCSNEQKQEYEFCEKELDVEKFKNHINL